MNLERNKLVTEDDEVLRVAKFIGTKSRMMAARGWGEEETELVCNGCEILVCRDENSLEIDSFDGCTAM